MSCQTVTRFDAKTTMPSRLGAAPGGGRAVPRRRWLPWMAAALLGWQATAQAADVGVSISIAQPGVYGRVDIGRFPQPLLVMPTPVLVQRTVVREPVYLWVPPGHRRNWRAHCSHYGACGVPVYFVQDGWYRQHVVADAPRFDDRGHGPMRDHDDKHGRHGGGHGRGHGHGHD